MKSHLLQINLTDDQYSDIVLAITGNTKYNGTLDIISISSISEEEHRKNTIRAIIENVSDVISNHFKNVISNHFIVEEGK